MQPTTTVPHHAAIAGSAKTQKPKIVWWKM